jgi:hypothetical protein
MKRFFTLLLVLFSFYIADAQRKKQEEAPAPPTPPRQNSIESKTSGLKKYTGYFDYWVDEKQDKVFLLIDKFDSEFMYVESLTAGIGSNDIGLDRNQLGKERVVKFERRGPKVLLTEVNYGYRAISENKMERLAVEQAFAQSVLWGFPVSAEDNGKVLIDLTDFLIQDVHEVIGKMRATQQGNYTLDKTRSALYLPATKNFPKNSEFEVTLTFTGNPTGNYITTVAPTATSVTVREHLSFIELPDSDYKPREFDPRAGYSPGISYMDYATPISEPIQKRFISRHRLKKKNPEAERSEAVEPIIYYLDPGTPEPIRSALLEGARWWNQAFEAAGYINAFQVEILPEGADPMDVRYNMINWVHRSTRGWSYGSSVMDPRTGEIIKGHVTLGSLRVRQDFLIAEGLLAPYETGKPVSKEMEQMAVSRLRQLSAHEVGHTLGLSHSYASSAENLASVMDYPHPVVKLKDGKVDLSQAYDNKIGIFDKVAINWGYREFSAGTDEKSALNKIITDSHKAGLTFLSDQDGRPTGSAHPYTHLWDNGADAADELNRIMEIRSIVLKNFGENNIREGSPMAMIEEVLVPMYFLHRYQTEAASKVIGGLNYRYAIRGDGQPVTEFVPAAAQMKALDALLNTVSASSLRLPESLMKNIPPRPLGYVRHRELIKIKTELTFDPLSLTETAADLTYSLLMHPARANRLVEYHGRDNSQPALEAVLDKIIIHAFRSGNTTGHAGNLQMNIATAALMNLARLSVHRDASSQVKAISMMRLEQLKSWLTRPQNFQSDETLRAFHMWCASVIDGLKENPDEFKSEPALPAPPGQPIGSDELICPGW